MNRSETGYIGNGVRGDDSIDVAWFGWNDNRRNNGALLGRTTTTVAQLTGDVIFIEQVAGEQPDFDWCRFLARCVWFGVIILIPLVALHLVLVHLGPLSLLLSLFALLILLRFLMPQNLWALVHLIALLNPFNRHNGPGVPVRHLRVRTNDGYEVMVRMKGRPLRGNLMMDDEVTFRGTWRDGVLFSRRAYSHRTASWIEMECDRAWASLIAAIMVLLTLTYYLHIAIQSVTQHLPLQ
jgi:hypothetical protein